MAAAEEKTDLVSYPIKLPQSARPGMPIAIKLPTGEKIEIRVPPGYKPGATLKINVRKHKTANMGAVDTRRALPIDHATGQFHRPAAIEDAEAGHTVRAHVQRMQEDVQRTVQNTFGGRYGDPLKDFFQHWSNYEMCQALVDRGIEIRHERHARHEQLVGACAEEFGDEIMDGHGPIRPVRDSASDMMFKNAVALKFQMLWFTYVQERNHSKMTALAEQDPYLNPNGFQTPDSSNETFSSYRSKTEDLYEQGRAEDAESGSLNSGHERDKYLETPWERPSITSADVYLDHNHPRVGGAGGKPFTMKSTTGRHCTLGGCGEQLDLWDEGMVSEFAQFGTGIVLYFKFLKWLFWIFLVLSICYLPMIIVNSYGEGVADTSFLGSLSLTSIGNLGDPTNVTEMTLPGCSVYNYLLANFFEDQSSCVVDKRQLGLAYSVIDVFALTFLFVAVLWLRHFEEAEVSYLDRNTVTPSDFTVYIPWVPPETTEESLQQYFYKRGKRVVDVNLGFNNGDLINKYKLRANLQFARYKIGQQIRFWKSRSKLMHIDTAQTGCCSSEYSDAKEDQLLKERDDIMRNIRRLELEISKSSIATKPLSAFVSFNTEDDMADSVREFKFSAMRRLCMALGCCINAKDLFLGKYLLRVKQAPNPSTVVWENIKYTAQQRFYRRAVTMVSCLLMILFSLAMTVLSTHFQELIKSTDAVCPADFYDKSEDEKIEFIEENSDYVQCYCDELSIEEQSNDSNCRTYYLRSLYSFMLQGMAILSVLAMNMFIAWRINKMAKNYEKHHSNDGEEQSVFVRTFFLKFVNTGCLYLIINNKDFTEFVQGVSGDEVSLDSGIKADFSVGWYIKIAPILITIMMSNIAAVHAPVLRRFYLHRRAERKLRKLGVQDVDVPQKRDGLFCQDDLNQKFLGPPFHLHLRYAQVMVTYFVAMMYGMGIPILMPVACVSFYVTYLFDKAMFIKYYRHPPGYSHAISFSASKLLVYGIVLHVCFALWMFSDGLIFSSDSEFETNAAVDAYTEDVHDQSLYTKLTQRHTIVLTISLMVLLVYLLIVHVFGTMFRFLNIIFKLFTCQPLGDRYGKVTNLVSTTYRNALVRGLIRGLPTYNILLNPVYRDAFRINPKFAAKHKHVDSVRQWRLEQSDARSIRLSSDRFIPTESENPMSTGSDGGGKRTAAVPRRASAVPTKMAAVPIAIHNEI